MAARARAAQPWSIYLLECKGGVIYTGIARDVAERYAAHKEGTGARFTRSHPPRRLLIEVAFPNQRDASRAECAVKRLTAAQKRALVRRLRALPPEQWGAAVLPAVDSNAAI
ncbi:MAG: GIY-YIG nuclease family protein [Betaproteobacteria bacterium]